MRSVAPRLSRETALQRLRLPAGSGGRSAERPGLPRVELVGLPCFRVEVEAVGWRGARSAVYIVDAVGGGAVRLDGDVEWCDGGGAARLDPQLTAEQAEAETRALFARAALLARWARPRLCSVATPELVAYPYWVGYYERRPGRLDVRVLDALTGRPAGAAVKRSLLSAFVAACAGSKPAGAARRPAATAAET